MDQVIRNQTLDTVIQLLQALRFSRVSTPEARVKVLNAVLRLLLTLRILEAGSTPVPKPFLELMEWFCAHEEDLTANPFLEG